MCKPALWSKSNYKWVNILGGIVDEFNNTNHKTIGMKPKDLRKKDENVLLNTVQSYLKIIDPKIRKFQ